MLHVKMLLKPEKILTPGKRNSNSIIIKIKKIVLYVVIKISQIRWVPPLVKLMQLLHMELVDVIIVQQIYRDFGATMLVQ